MTDLHAIAVVPSALYAEIDALARSVESTDGSHLRLELSQPSPAGAPEPWPATDVIGTRAVLARRAGRLVGFAGLDGRGLPEVTGMVAPTARRAGVGTALLAMIRRLLSDRGDSELLLIVPGGERETRGSGGKFALGHGGRADHSEFQLTLTATPPPAGPDVRLTPATPSDLPILQRLTLDGFGTAATGIAEMFLIRHANRVIGCLGKHLSDGVGTVFGFVVDPVARGSGLGRAALSLACHTLQQQGSHRVDLEVTADNDRALGLYRSIGFRQVGVQDYFRLPVLVPPGTGTASARMGTAVHGQGPDRSIT